MKKTFKRIVAAVLVAVMLISSAPVMNLQASAAGYTVYSQKDSRWGSTFYGYSNSAGTKRTNIYNAGCGLLALVNAVNYLTGNFIQPQSLAEFSLNNGCRVNGVGTDSGKLCQKFASSQGNNYGFYYAGGDGAASKTSILSNLKNMLQNGCVAVGGSTTLATGGGHIMAIVDYDPSSNKFLIFDSYTSPNRFVGDYSWQTLNSSLTTGNGKVRFSGYFSYLKKIEKENDDSLSNTSSSITASNLTYPTQIKQGSAFYFKGTISSKSKIRHAGIIITDSNGNNVSYATKTINPDSTYVDISTQIDPDIHMSKLPIGTYTCKIVASTSLFNAFAYKTLHKSTFKVVSSGSNKSETNKYVNIEEKNDANINTDSFKDLDNYPTGTYKVTAQKGLYIRTGPGTNYDKVGGLGNGETVSITKTDGQWGKCSQGWICLEYATLVSSSSGSSSSNEYNSSASYKTGYYIVKANGGLNVRSGSGTNYGRVSGLDDGVKIAVREISGNWGKCDSGWICLDYTTYSGSLEPVINVPAAPKLSRTSAENVACGTTLTVTWSPAADATCYDVYLKNSSGTVCQKLIGTNGNSASFTVNDAGTYSITAYSRNTKYTSAVSNTISAKFHAPSTVKFVDWDGTVLSSQTVAYGTSATTPGNPSRYGWTFEKWNGNYNTVTENRTITATYKRNIYSVSFLDENGDLIGTKQKIEFEGSATAPDYTAPEGYTFLGWDKEFDYIESNLTIKPVNVWSNKDLPVTISSTSAVVRSSSGYTVTVNVVNNPDTATDGRVIVALKTDEDKLLSMTESAAFHLKPDSDLDEDELGETKAIEVYVPYEGVATKADIYVVENFSTAIPISAVKSVDIDLGTDWTDWSTTQLEEYHAVESRTEYRNRTKSTKTSSSSSLSGWTKYNTTWTWSSYGSWSSWTDSYISETDSRDVETRTVQVPASYKTLYHYYRWRSPDGSDGESYQKNSSYVWQEITLDEPLTDTSWGGGYKWWHNGVNYHTMWKCADWGTQVVASYKNKTQYRYRERSKVYTYYFYKWSSWSDWSATPVTAADGKEVETRTTYRYQVNDPSLVADTSGTVRTISGTVDPSLAGEQATLFIYKVDEASDFTNEYVGQTVIADDGSYSFTFKLREEPSVKTGDYTVTLGIEGTSAAIYLDPIEAPKPQYTVEFIDWDGTPIETQTVTEGENAIIPETIPEREGYDFICWNNTGTNVKDDMTISPVYRIKTYTVVFVDWTNETVEMQNYEHGQPLAPPVLEDTVDEEAVGWDAILEGTTAVTQNMIITAKYETKIFVVKFLDSDNTVLDSQTVEYGESAVIPEVLSSDNAVLYDWDTSSSLTTVTEDQIVVPVYYYKETVTNPTSSVITGEYDEPQTVELTCENEDAVIYYSLDGTDPLAYGTEYTEPFVIDSSCELKYAACAFEKNDSEIISELVAINDGNAENAHIVTFFGESWGEEFSMLVTENEPIVLEESDYTIDGYDFVGVYTDVDYTDEWNLVTDVVTESMDLYFKWTPKTYTATFIGYDGEILSEQSVNYSEYAEMPEVPEIDGYVFCGFDKDSLVITEDTTLTAKYVPEDEFVTVSLNKSKYRLFNGTSTTLVATLTPSDVENSYAYWTSSDENVAVVDDNGKVTAVGKGTAEIYAISNITGHAAVCKITVISNIDEDITLTDGTDAGFDSEGQLRGVSVGENTVAEVSAMFENTSLTFVDINGNKLADDDLVGTGTKIQLVNGDEVADEVVVVVTGDYNGDGLINNRDAAMITRYLVDKEVASLAQLTAIDVNGDGYVNNRDASMVSRYLVGKETI